MEDSHSTVKWEDLAIDMLVEIFKLLGIYELTGITEDSHPTAGSGIALVCSAWHMAYCDPLLWKTLDLSMLKSNFIKIQVWPDGYVTESSNAFLTRLLKTSLSLSKGNIMTLIFHCNLYISNDQLTYTAERCPKLRRLVLPAWNRIKTEGMIKAIRGWKDLESLTMPAIQDASYLLKEIEANCKNFSELKIMGPCHHGLASSITKYLSKLRVLSLRCSMLFKDVLILILDSLQHLEVLNISHCILMETFRLPGIKEL